MDVRLYPSAPPVGARPGAEPAGLAHLDYYHCGKVGAGGSPAGGGPRLRTESEPERPGLERGQESPGGVLSGTRAGEGGAGGAHARRHAPRRPADGHTPLTRIPLTLTPRVALITGRSHPDRHSRGDRDTHTYPGPPTASPSFTSGPAAAPTATHLLTASPSHTTRPDSHAQGHASLAHLHTRPHCRTRATRTPHTSFPARPLSHPVSHNWGRAHKEVAPTARRSPSRRLPEARTATHSRPGTVTLRHTNRPDGHSHTPSRRGSPGPGPAPPLPHPVRHTRPVEVQLLRLRGALIGPLTKCLLPPGGPRIPSLQWPIQACSLPERCTGAPPGWGCREGHRPLLPRPPSPPPPGSRCAAPGAEDVRVPGAQDRRRPHPLPAPSRPGPLGAPAPSASLPSPGRKL